MSRDYVMVQVGTRFNRLTGEPMPVMRRQITCDCGSPVVCEYATNTCKCGSDYNTSGQRLADRKFWGEETGEHLLDILRAGEGY